MNLRLKPNKDLLNDLINKAQGLNAASYTLESWNALQNTLNNAKAVLTNEEATEAEISNAKSAMEAAIAGLEIKSALPAEVIKPNVVTNSNTGKESAIKTGDTVSMIYPLLGLVIAFLGFYGSKKRKDTYN